MQRFSLLKLAVGCLFLAAFLTPGNPGQAIGQATLAQPPIFAEQAPTFERVDSPTITNTLYIPLARRDYEIENGWMIILRENFENTFPGAWEVYDAFENDNLEFFWSKSNCRAYAGNFSGWAIGGGANGSGLPCNSLYPEDVDSWMVFGPFSLSNATAATFSFKTWYNTADSLDQLCAVASSNGATFNRVCRHGNSNGWVDFSVSLKDGFPGGSLLNRSRVWVGIQFVSYTSGTKLPEGAYVDNIVLRKCMPGYTCTGQAEVMP